MFSSEEMIKLLGLLILVGCGGEQASLVSGQMAGAGLSVTVKGAARIAPTSEWGRIVSYRVTVSGPDIDPPIVAEFPGDADDGIIEGVPRGRHRLVAVTATNERGQCIWMGEATDVVIPGGSTAHASVELESVPVFVNVVDGGRIENTRFVVRTFSSAGENVVVDDATPANEVALADAATLVTDVTPDAATGIGTLRPTLLAPGEHVLTVTSQVTGRASQISIRITDGTTARAASLFSSGSVERGQGAAIWHAGATVHDMTLSLQEGL